jgi:V8-like Glu-specific endopeptidase
MRITLSSRVVALTAGIALAVGAQALLPQAATAAVPRTLATHRAHPPHRSHPSHRSPWVTGNTAGRGLRLVHGGAVAASVGKIFFTLGRTDYVCSGALVRSKHATVVLTAAHCVRGAGGQWATDWTFVPGYADGAQPYGQYTAHRFFVSPRWRGPDTERYDVAFVQVTRVVTPGSRSRSRSAATPAGLPVRFAASQTTEATPSPAYVLGYPALAPYTGQYPNYCAGPAAGSATRQGSVRTRCLMTAGDSGGPFLTGFSPSSDTGTITAVTAYKLSGDSRTLYGIVLGPSALALYLRASA